jgi:hypothetical protein
MSPSRLRAWDASKRFSNDEALLVSDKLRSLRVSARLCQDTSVHSVIQIMNSEQERDSFSGSDRR